MDFGAELAELMRLRGVGVRALARRVPCDAALISRLARGRQRPSEQMAQRLDDLLGAQGHLTAARSAANAVPAGPDTRPDARALQARLGSFSAAQVHELLSHLAEQWHALVKTDNLLGPRHALGAVNDNLRILEALLRAVRPPVRESALRLAARYAESAAWLCEDSADLVMARYWTRQAAEWALEGDDRLMLSWTLFRRSQQAGAGRDAAQMAGLAAAARRAGGPLPGPMLAAILQQEARALALDGDESACHQKLDEAHSLAAAADDPGDAAAGHGSFCTPAYLEMQRGACWLTLGNPGRAVAGLDAAIKSMPPAYRRDRGVALSMQAAAFAACGEPVQAARAGTAALDIARASGSGRLLGMVGAVVTSLSDSGQVDAVVRLRAAVGANGAV